MGRAGLSVRRLLGQAWHTQWASVMGDRGSMRAERRAALILIASLLLLAAGGAYGGIGLRWFRAPFPDFGKRVAWAIGKPEAAYNFDPVVPGRLYRSGRPDPRFLRYLRREYGIQRVISLMGPVAAHEAATALGLEVTVFHWSTEHLPPRPELEQLMQLLEGGERVLLHCAGGSDRTGYAVAVYRVRHQSWSLERAVKEMAGYWHDWERNPGLHRELKELLDDG